MILYVHIPFCHRICPYCSFYKHTPGNTDLRAFIAAITDEAQWQRQSLEQHKATLGTITSLYLGGGTPSMLSPRHLDLLFGGLNEAFDLSQTHITLEANPATFNHSKAKRFKELGVTRTSLGIQSFSPHVLQTLGREHSPQQARESVHILRDAGMEEINIDLMFSVPGQSEEDWQHSLDTAIGLEPDHISAYNLTYEEDTEFIQRLTHGEFRDDEATNAEYYSLADRSLSDAGFLHYETSNYAQPGKESQHNRSYWLGHDYLGLGPSAVSTIQGRRWQNLPDTARYIQNITSVGHAMADSETIDEEAYRIERIALLLRTREGVPVKYLQHSPAGSVQELLDNRLAEIDNHHLRLIHEGPMLVDPIAAKLI
ncbi:radical SAM family heme chaperone HemW [Verrucomicrobiaceae bacterium N1E253]|uniref:Heme chaperone HemW n=1 Tax=Oceaniferula marina TaxID=2748318 RepID=A0A851GID1_9BACT|nr:radical SAM family heme chaperone HemW [Oceaniferula marina]NWK54887.1 radical SAM family heme chaperone HemW [Oceaniferula marina]